MKSSRILLASACAAAYLSGASASAAVLAIDTFAYATGAPLAGNTGGTGFGANPWGAPETVNTGTNVLDVTSNPLQYTPAGGALIDGGSQAVEIRNNATISQAGTAGAAANFNRAGARALATPLSADGVYYARFLVRVETPADATGNDPFAGANNTLALHLSNADNNNASINFGVRGVLPTVAVPVPNEFMVRNATGVPVAGASSDGQLLVGQTNLVVVKLTRSAGLFSSADLWANPGIADAGTPDGTLSLSSGALASISHLFFRQAANQNLNGSLTNDVNLNQDIFLVDELVIGETWADVVGVPEPASAGMALALLTAVAPWRRRR